MWYSVRSAATRDQAFVHGGFFSSRGGRPKIVNVRAVRDNASGPGAYLISFTADRVINNLATWVATVDGETTPIASGVLGRHFLTLNIVDPVAFKYQRNAPVTLRIHLEDTKTCWATEETVSIQ
jgi:hypothetical protein